MAPGDRLPPERLLAGQYEVSLITVREAIRILAAEGRVERVQGKGTFVSQPKRTALQGIALLIHHDILHPQASPFYLTLAQEIRTLLDAEGLRSRLYISHRAPGQDQADFHCPEFFEDLEAGRIKGVIGVLLAGRAPWVEELQARGIPLVGYGASKRFGAMGSLRSYFASAIAELAGRGRRRIALLAWGGFDNDRSQQASLFCETLQEAGLPVVEGWIRDDIYPALDGAGWGGLREIWSASPERPDGVILADDFFMRGLTTAVAEMGLRVPEQLEVAVNLVSWPAGMQPFPILAWRPDFARISRAIVDAEMQMLRGETPDPAMKRIPTIRAPELDAPGLSGPLPTHAFLQI